ncbi:MAG TPA: biopolymer transporter ExbD [Pseudomonadales bacterium]
MQFKRQARRELDVNLTPLIDVVFLLLIFFMVSTTFTDKTQLTIDLPKASGDIQIKDSQAIEVVINDQGEYAVNGQRLINDHFATLKSAISQARQDQQQSFVITADAKAPHQAVVMAMDAAGQLGISNLSVTTIRPDE